MVAGNKMWLQSNIGHVDTLLSPEEFTAFLLQDVANLNQNTRIHWLFLLAYSVSDKI